MAYSVISFCEKALDDSVSDENPFVDGDLLQTSLPQLMIGRLLSWSLFYSQLASYKVEAFLCFPFYRAWGFWHLPDFDILDDSSPLMSFLFSLRQTQLVDCLFFGWKDCFSFYFILCLAHLLIAISDLGNSQFCDLLPN